MPFRRKRTDTLVGTIEKRYGVDFGVRSDTKLGNLLRQERATSVSQLVARYQRAQATPRVFISFDADDRQQVDGFRLLKFNTNVELEIHDASLRVPIDSENAGYIKQQLRQKIVRASVTVCLIGSRTYTSRWVEWELRTSAEMGKGILGIRLKGCHGDGPAVLRELGAKIIDWDPHRFAAEITKASINR